MSALPKIPGLQTVNRQKGCFVYFLTKGREVIYVGKSTSLFNRIANHPIRDFDALHFIPVPEAELDETEMHYIGLLLPKYNVLVRRSRIASVPVDACIADIVKALNAAGILTSGCCCGHGRGDGSILLQDGRELVIK